MTKGRSVTKGGRSRSTAVGNFRVRVGALTQEPAHAHRSKIFWMCESQMHNVLDFDSLDQNLLDSTSDFAFR
jgi:hypothetical protein